MRRSTDIIFNVTGQTLLHRVQQGRPTSATFAVFHENTTDDGTPEWSGTATVENVDTTLDAAAGVGEADRTLISLAAGGGTNVVVERRYRISQNGRSEWVLIVDKNGDDLVASAPLQNAYTSGADFEGTHITAAVDATWVADESHLSDMDASPDYRIRWAIVVAGATYIEHTFFDLVRGAIGHGITMHDLEDRFFNILDSLPINHRDNGGMRILDAAWRDVKAALSGAHINASALRDAELVDQLVIHRVRLTFAENGRRPSDMTPAEFLAYAADMYDRFFEQHFKLSSKVAVAGQSGAVATKKAAAPPWRS
jgi:hypothetical protein